MNLGFENRLTGWSNKVLTHCTAWLLGLVSGGELGRAVSFLTKPAAEWAVNELEC